MLQAWIESDDRARKRQRVGYQPAYQPSPDSPVYHGTGQPLGYAIPTVKIASNNVLFVKKPYWIDFNAGVVLEHGSVDTAARELWRLVLDVASGRQHTCSEENDDREIMIFKDGVIL